MKTNELKKELREMTAQVAIAEHAKSSNEVKQEAAMKLAKYEKNLKLDGYKVKREHYYGMDGLTAYESDMKAEWFAAIPKKIKVGAKPRVTIYALADVVLADMFDARMCADDVTLEELRKIEDEADARIQSAGLLGSIYAGCEAVAYELRMNETAKEEPEHKEKETISTQSETVKNAMEEYKAGRICKREVMELDGIVFSQKRPGTCVWATGNTMKYKEWLKEDGYRWSRKRKAWYMKPNAA